MLQYYKVKVSDQTLTERDRRSHRLDFIDSDTDGESDINHDKEET